MIKRLFSGAKITYGIFAFVILGLLCNIVYLGVTGTHLVSKNQIEEYAKNRGEVTEVLYAERGKIISSDNDIIATTVDSYKLIAYVNKDRINMSDTPAYVVDATEVATLVGPIIKMDVTEMEQKIQAALDDESIHQIEFGTYGNNIDPLVKEQIESFALSGLTLEKQTKRYYRNGNFASYIIGYALNDSEDNKLITGRMGLEKMYDEILSGKNGFRQYQVDTKGVELPNGTLKQEEEEHGQDIYLTINASLQRKLEVNLVRSAEQMEAESAVCVIMEAKTGKILALSSYPSFNPNDREIENYNNIFFDQTYECGSVFKPFVYANVIEDGNYDDNATFTSGRYQLYYGNTFVAPISDWNDGVGFGTITYKEGLARSSNVAIANLIRSYADKESLVEDYHKLGFFESSEIDGFESPAGTEIYVTTQDKPLEHITTGFGQGSTVTALQLLRAYSIFANDGKTVEPYLVDKIVDTDSGEVTYTGTTQYSERVFSSETISKMNDFLYTCIYGKNSVGQLANYPFEDDEVIYMGKTGTGQIPAGKNGYRSDVYSKSFAGLAPYDDPQIVIYTMFQCKDKGTSPMIAEFVKSMLPEALATNAEYTNIETSDTTKYEMDSFINQSVSFTKSKLEAKDMVVEVIGNGSSVLEQFPLANTTINIGNRVFIRSDGNTITVPDMEGWSRKEVTIFASMAGLELQIYGEAGMVINQSIRSGTEIQSGERLEVTVE